MKKFFFAALFVFFTAVQLFADEDWFTGKISENLVNKSGESVKTAEALKGKMVAFYFTASWCGPCRAFTPTLVKFYKKTAKKSNLEIVLVSSDKTEKEMKAYMKKNSMPWLAIPFDDPALASFKKEMKVNGIPTLIVFDENGKLISSNARWDVVMLGEKAVSEWKKEDYKPLTYNDYNAKKGKANKKSKSKRTKKRK